jgi:hypothetical protein
MQCDRYFKGVLLGLKLWVNGIPFPVLKTWVKSHLILLLVLLGSISITEMEWNEMTEAFPRHWLTAKAVWWNAEFTQPNIEKGENFFYLKRWNDR